MVKLIKEREYVDDVYTVVSEESRNMEDDLRGIYVGDMLEEIDYELKQEGFNLVYTDECITPKDCKYSKYTDGKFEVIVYYAENDSIIRDIYVNEVVNESYKRSNIQEKIFPDQYQSNIDGKTYTIRWHDDKRQFYVQIPCARKTLWSDDPEDLMGKIDIELKKCYKNESLHWGLYPNESKEEAKEDAYTIYRRGDIYSLKDIKRFLEGHSDTYISFVMAYLDKLDNNMYESKFNRLHEQNVEIEVKHEGILEVPEGKNVEDLPIKHFVDLAKKKGLSKITKALNNLQVWNKNKDKKLSKWAGDMIDKLTKKYGKNESVRKTKLQQMDELESQGYDVIDSGYEDYKDIEAKWKKKGYDVKSFFVRSDTSSDLVCHIFQML